MAADELYFPETSSMILESRPAGHPYLIFRTLSEVSHDNLVTVAFQIIILSHSAYVLNVALKFAFDLQSLGCTVTL